MWKYRYRLLLFLLVFVWALTTSTDFVSLFSNYETVQFDDISMECSLSDEDCSVVYKIKPSKLVPITNVRLRFVNDGELNLAGKGYVGLSDRSYGTTVWLNEFIFASTLEDDYVIPIRSTGEVTSLTIKLDYNPYSWGLLNLGVYKESHYTGVDEDALKNIGLELVEVNTPTKLSFDFARFFVVAYILFAIFYIKDERVSSKVYCGDKQDKRFTFGICTVHLLIMVLFALFALSARQLFLDYESMDMRDCFDFYILQFDAFMHGRLNLDLGFTAKELELLADAGDWIYIPVDRVLHLGGDLTALVFDLAYKDGQIYSYFGVLPALIAFLVYKLTGVLLCNMFMYMIAYTVFVIFIVKAIPKLFKVLGMKVYALPVYMMQFIVPCISLVYLIYADWASFTGRYAIFGLYGVAFGVVYLYLSLCAFDVVENVRRSCIYFALSGVAVVCVVLSRPITLLPFLCFLSPLYIRVLLDKEQVGKLSLVSSFAVPLVVGAIGVMWLNYARFGSPLDFGSAYQLTTYEVRANGLKFSFPVLADYFIQYYAPRLVLSDKFPFYRATWLLGYFDNSYSYINNTEQCWYTLFSFPLSYSLLTVGYIREKGSKWLQCLATGVVSSVVILYVVYCYGGVTIRYMTDVSVVLALCVIICFCRLFTVLTETKRFLSRRILYGVFVVTCWIGLMSAFVTPAGTLNGVMPVVFQGMSRFIHGY